MSEIQKVSSQLSPRKNQKDEEIDEVVIAQKQQQKQQTELSGFLKNNDSKKWEAYENSNQEMPCTFCIPRCWYSIRWTLMKPFYMRVYSDITVGEVLFFILVLAYTIGSFVIGLDLEGTGGASSNALGLVFVFAMRNNVLTFLFGISYERQLFWHKYVTISAVAIGILHWIQSWDESGEDEEKLSGLVLLILMTIILVISQFPFRRYLFNSFLRLHFALIFGIAIFSLLHEAKGGILGLLFCGIDWLIRLIILCINKKNTQKVKITRLPANVVRLSFPKNDMKYNAGQYYFICIPKVSYFEWHPFSISSAPDDKNITIHIRVLGNWTKQLYDLAEKNPNLETNCFFGGPYGVPAVDIDSDKYKLFIFITGGIGITPMQSISKDLIYQYARERNLKKIMFIWTVREKQMIQSVQNYDVDIHIDNESKVLPTSFQPDLMSQIKSSMPDKSQILDERYHLTKMKENPSAEELKKANIDLEKMSFLKFGRPDFDKVFQEMQEFASQNGEKRIAVLSSGPTSLMKSAAKFAQKYSQKGITFDYHGEFFEF